MPNFSKAIAGIFRLSKRISFSPQGFAELHRLQNFPSVHLHRQVVIDVFVPPSYHHQPERAFPVLLLNDGQDMEAIQMGDILERLYQQRRISEILVVAVHTGIQRLNEYGISQRPDYKNRGAKAAAYAQFITKELLPALRLRYRCSESPEHWAVAGFSLGGLSAFDIGWQHSHLFSKIGVFSGSFWWRSQVFQEHNPDGHRILHEVLRQSKKRERLRFWLQTGTEDETSDRNHNGIIDAIDDTLDVIRELKALGYNEQRDIRYVEIIGGRHDLPTWAKIMPDFLQWAFG